MSSVLTGTEIQKAVQKEQIKITPYIPECTGSESYDVHLGSFVAVYEYTVPDGMLPAIPYNKKVFDDLRANKNSDGMRMWFKSGDIDYYEQYRLYPWNYDPRNVKFALDPCDEKCHKLKFIKIPEAGLLLNPQFLFIGYTTESVTSSVYHINIDGTSTIGRNGALIHHTAGNIAAGFDGEIVLEIRIQHPLVIYPYMKIGQLFFSTLKGDITLYNTPGYQGQSGPKAAKTMTIISNHSEQLKQFEENLLQRNPNLNTTLKQAMYVNTK